MTGREKLKEESTKRRTVFRDNLLKENIDKVRAELYANVARSYFIKGAEYIIEEVCAWLRKTQPQETLPDTTIERLKKEFLED